MHRMYGDRSGVKEYTNTENAGIGVLKELEPEDWKALERLWAKRYKEEYLNENRESNTR